MEPDTIFLSVGDDSGDLHAANLMRSLHALKPDFRFIGLGMDRMAAEGLEPLQAAHAHGSALGFANLLRLGHHRERLDLCRRALDTETVRLVIPVDYGGFNMFLCREAARRGLPVFYYIPPQVYAHGRYRLRKLRKWVSRAGLIYPFEAELYRNWGVEAEYVGHPLFDELAANPPSDEVVAGLKKRFGANLIGIFPGSRLHEVRAHVPMVVEASRLIRREAPDAAFAMLASPRMRQAAQELAAGGGVEVLEDARPVELARAARVCLAKSGTVTLEVASQGTPMAIFYRASPFGAFVVHGIGEVSWFGIVNLLAGRMICPERMMARDDPAWLAARALELLRDGPEREECRSAIAQTMDGFARPGASARAAQSAVALLQ